MRDLEHVTSILVTHQIRDAQYVSTHEAMRRPDGSVEIVAHEGVEHARFLVLHDGAIYFEGSMDELLASSDPCCANSSSLTLPPW